MVNLRSITVYILFLVSITILGKVVAAPLDKSRFRIDAPDRNGEVFLAGVYMYRPTYTRNDPRDGQGWDKTSLEAHFRWLSQLGVNLIHTDDIRMKDRDDTTTFLALAEKYNLKVIWQIGDSFVNRNDAGPTLEGWCSQRCVNGAYYAGRKIKEFQSNNTNILAYSVNEEPHHNPISIEQPCLTNYTVTLADGTIETRVRVDEMCFLMNYYEKIIYNVVQEGGTNDVPLFLLHNKTQTAQFIKDNYTGYETNVPILTGSDRYFMARDETYLFNPNKALNLFDNPDLNNNENKGIIAFRKNKLEPQTFLSVISGNSQIIFNDDGELDISLPGFNYYAPKYAIRAQVWLSIANGSHGIMAWSADVLDQDATSNLKISNMVGPDHRGHRTLFEYAETIRELQKFGWIINRTENPATDNSILAGNDNMIVSHSLNIEGVPNGKLYVVVNKKISTDTQASSIDDGRYSFNSQGELSEESFPPIDESSTIQFSTSVSSIYNIATGEQYSSGDTLTIEPGAGIMLFKGTLADLNNIRKLSGIASTYKINGTLSGDLDNRYLNKRIVFPAAPIKGTGSYVIDGLFQEREFELDRRYRLHAAVTGKDGASFQARIFGYQNGIQTATSDIGISETLVGSDITNIVSDDFTITSSEADTARVYFYHQNKTGELTIHDAWLEDVTDETSFSSYYKINYGISLSPNKTYKVYVEARELENEDSNIGVRYLAFNSQNQIIETKDIPGVVWGTELTNNFQFVTSDESKFNVSHPDVAYIRIAIYRPNKNTKPDNTIVLRNVWVEEIL
ncbi:hypothetical protein [Aliikangiella coralliicola]|uniref:Uncharacterized protein n=1 Tax=Aliikangiella coralliicola TaxID=2592383 RepID=A0A545UJC9_9GAMM|nr:hypothetical protein [Aliikangiella coralliicola]TQV89543.1 hypothetical protein FLL46_01275 [Aliikangiella coralliicola]